MSYAGKVSPTSPRPRAGTSQSFHSRKSSGSGNLIESHEEKEGKRLHTKADPSVAMNEAEPATIALQQAASISPIRSIQHRDAQGNPIADPDRSNPTRSRWERPLDTIRSFEAAIDGNYSRKSMYRADPSDVASNYGGGGYNRRSSYFAGSLMGMDDRPRFPPNNYYGRPNYRPDSTYMTRPDSYYNGGGGGGYDMGPNPGNGYQPQRARYPARTASEPFVNGQGFYPGNQQSYETVTTASGSGSSGEPAGYQTDPSSENSSMDRIAALPGHPAESYGYNGFGGDPQYGPPGPGMNQPYNPAQRQGDGYMNHPQPPQRDVGPRVPIKLGNSNGPPAEVRPSPGEKRKSWFGRRFSRS